MGDGANAEVRSDLAARYDRDWLGTPIVQPYTKFWRFPHSAADMARAAMGPLRDQRVLELAAGAGTNALALADCGAHVVATELSRGGLRALARLAANHPLPPRGVQCDATRLPFAARSFDLVTGENFLMHVDPAAVLAECHRVLRPGGRVVFLEPTAHHPLVRLYRRVASPYRQTRPRYLSLDSLTGAASEFRLARVDPRYFLAVLSLFVTWQPALFSWVFRVLDYADRWLFRAWPRVRRYAWLAVIVLHKPRD